STRHIHPSPTRRSSDLATPGLARRRMTQIIFNLQFRGSAAPAGEDGVMKATTSATSCSMETIMGPQGVKGTFSPTEGGLAYFERSEEHTSELQSLAYLV